MSILIDETTKRVALQAEDHRVARVAQASRIFVREIAQLRKQLVEALEEQTATSEVLRIISNSPNEIQSPCWARWPKMRLACATRATR